MKLIIQIPAYNEQDSLPVTIRSLPKKIKGIKKIEVLVIDDGSIDDTSKVAKSCGVEHILNIPVNRGLANAYISGINYCLSVGADIIVNTDADNQYCAKDIEKLVAPILNNQAELVIGSRPVDQTKHFSYIKKKLQRIGSWVVRFVSQTSVEDAPSGFRAISRSTALRQYLFSNYSYTLETIIQAGQSGMRIISVPIRTNEDLRPSRLAKSMASYVIKSVISIFQIFMIYRPFKSFLYLGSIPFLVGLFLGFRWLYLFLIEESIRTHLPSLILASILIIVSFQIFLFGFLAELISANRKILEETKLKLKLIELNEK